MLVAIDLDLLGVPAARNNVRLSRLVLLEEQQLASVAACVVVPPSEVLLFPHIDDDERDGTQVVLVLGSSRSLDELAVFLVTFVTPRQARRYHHHRGLFRHSLKHLQGDLLYILTRRQLDVLLLLIELAVILHPILAHQGLHRRVVLGQAVPPMGDLLLHAHGDAVRLRVQGVLLRIAQRERGVRRHDKFAQLEVQGVWLATAVLGGHADLVVEE
mmetsp:Transcript_59685/g.172271  ORF Transcript_59685/g.172271 Transcript_59685/m.172271 type:complete len:215 (-) Transcript_59685:1764-2408(-)